MNLIRAFALLFFASLKNRIRRWVQRLRKPRFLVATLVGLFYFWQIIFRRWWLFTQPMPSSPLRELAVGYLRPFAEMGLVALGLFQVLGAWAFGDERAQLAFTEAEVHFFFTAPASRLALVHYKLLRGLLLLLFGAVVTAAFIGRAVSQHAFLFTVGAWVALTTTSLHRIAASFTRERLAKRGWWGSAIVWGLLGATVLGLGYGVQSTLATEGVPTSMAAAAALARHVMDAAPVSWILFPIRLLVRPMLATDGASFARAIPAALGVLAVQYVWLILTVTPFEEASAEAAELRSQMLEARRTRQPTGATLTFRRAPWSLAGTGRPETALAWKNGLAVLRRIPLRSTGLLAVLALAVVLFVALSGGQSGRIGLVPLLGSFVSMAVLIGPVRMSLDLRHDLDRIDLLRALPLTGQQIVLAEMVAPTLALAVLEWVLLALAVGLGGDIGGLDLHARLAIGLSAALVCPALTMVGMVVQNAAALMFPDWMAAFRERRRGFDAVGQRLLTLAGSVVVLAVGALPAAIVSAGLLWVLWSPLEWAAAPIAAAVATGALLIEVGVGAALIGKLFDAHDVSAT